MTASTQNNEVIVLGSGVSGITTALTLQLQGFSTQCIGAHQVGDTENEKDSDPLFASQYPAASIIPHSVRSERMAVLFKDSKHIFQQLFASECEFIRKNLHYEWFQFPVSKPGYTGWMDNFTMLTSEEQFPVSGKNFPEWNSDSINGWSFNCFFVDWPRYASKLYSWYEEVGGKLIKRRLTRHDIASLDASILINCTGANSRHLFRDEGDFCYLLGKSIIVEDGPDATQYNPVISYNYTPGAEIYSHSSCNPVDVYCYPRKSGWVLGGSRLHGHLDEKGRWSGEQWTGRMLSIDKQQIPAPIYEINRKLIQNLYDIDIADYKLRAKSGYRFMRDSSDNALRLEEDHQHGKTVFHNYGHGGAGVTLSWGCAIQISRLLRNHIQPTQENLSKKLDSPLNLLREELEKLR